MEDVLFNIVAQTSITAAAGMGTNMYLAKVAMDIVAKHIEPTEFGINAELLIDHAWEWEPVTIADIKDYKPEVKSINSGRTFCGFDRT